MLKHLITIALLLSYCTGGLCALPAAASCPMEMGSAGCQEAEAQVERPCCCTIDRDATPANPSQQPVTPVMGPEFMSTLSANFVWIVPAAYLPRLRPTDRLPVQPPDLLCLHNILRI